MTTKTFIKTVAEKNGMTQKAVKEMADAFEIAIKEAVAAGETFKFADVTYSVKATSERVGFNPLKGEKITIPASKKITLKASRDLKLTAKNK